MTDRVLPVAIDAEIDEQWMSAALGHPDGIASMTRASIGTGQVGENVRYELTWQGDVDLESVPASVVGKFPSLDELSRETAKATSAYVREVGFYRDLQANVSIPTPHLFHLGEDLDQNRFVLIMEDVRLATQGDQLAGCSVEDAQRSVAALGGLHGPLWSSPLADRFDWISARTPDRAAEMSGLLDMVVPGFMDRYGSRLAPEVFDAVHWVVAKYTRWFTSFETPTTLVHGDYRLDNMLFSTAPQARPLTVVDWQTAALGHGPADAAYFVGAGLLPETRREVESDLIVLYHQSLTDSGVSVDLEVVRRDYGRGSVSGLIMAVVASQIVGQTDRGDEMFCVMAERHATQMADLGVADLIG